MYVPFLIGVALVVQVAAPVADSSVRSQISGPQIDRLTVGVRRDTVPVRPRPRARAIEYSDWYQRRATVHRIASWATLPLFAAEVVTGQELFDNGPQAADWAQDAHGVVAGSLGALFAVNTVTGAWNLWAARKDPSNRKWRTTHALLMLVADAGFAYAGSLAEDAEESGAKRAQHRTVAITSSSIALLSYAMMLPPLRRD